MVWGPAGVDFRSIDMKERGETLRDVLEESLIYVALPPLARLTCGDRMARKPFLGNRLISYQFHAAGRSKISGCREPSASRLE